MICQCLADQFIMCLSHFTVTIQVETRLELTITLPPLLC